LQFFAFEVRWQESNLRHDGSEPPARASTGPTAMWDAERAASMCTVSTLLHFARFGEKDSNPHLLLQRQGASPLADPRTHSLGVRTAGFEPAISCARGTRIKPGFPHPVFQTKRPAGVEPAHPPWRGSRQPLHHGRASSQPNCQGSRAPGRTRTGVSALRVRSPSR
jgi:hypothetical protein